MLIYPAIDLYDGKAVRLYKGDYEKMTVYSSDPPEIAEKFRDCGATHMHIVDLDGAKSGATPNFDTVIEIKRRGGLFCEVGGGIRSMEVINRYLTAGIDRVILGTAAVTEEKFVEEAVKKYSEKIAVGIDIKDGFVATSLSKQGKEYPGEFYLTKKENGYYKINCVPHGKPRSHPG